jgi:hypothetical protein
MGSTTAMAALSLGVVMLFAGVMVAISVRVFNRTVIR